MRRTIRDESGFPRLITVTVLVLYTCMQKPFTRDKRVTQEPGTRDKRVTQEPGTRDKRVTQEPGTRDKRVTQEPGTRDKHRCHLRTGEKTGTLDKRRPLMSLQAAPAMRKLTVNTLDVAASSTNTAKAAYVEKGLL
jgi:hypothetical protein